MIEITTALSDARLAATLAFIDSGEGTPRLEVYAAPRPAVGAAAAGVPLVAIDLARPVGTLAGGVLTLQAASIGVVLQTGTAAWARVVNAAGQVAFDCSVSALAGAGEVRLTTVDLYAGASTALVSAVLG